MPTYKYLFGVTDDPEDWDKISNSSSVDPEEIPSSIITIPSTETEFKDNVYDILLDCYGYVSVGILERLNVFILSLMEDDK